MMLRCFFALVSAFAGLFSASVSALAHPHVWVTVKSDLVYAPLPAKEVTLFFSSAASGIEPLRLSATYVEGAAWSVENVALPAIGRWQVRVEILVNDFEKVSIEDEIALLR